MGHADDKGRFGIMCEDMPLILSAIILAAGLPVSPPELSLADISKGLSNGCRIVTTGVVTEIGDDEIDADYKRLMLRDGDKVAAELKRQMPEYRVYFLTGSRLRRQPWTAEAIIAKLRELNADGVDISYAPEIHDAAFIRKIHDAGFSFHVWTVDSLENAERAFAAGADTLTTNRAKTLLDGHRGR